MPAQVSFTPILAAIFAAWFALSAQAGPAILSPAAGDALQGVVTVTGTTQIEGFASAELSFTYENGEDATWFLISQMSEPLTKDVLGAWDTTTIADGQYRLRLRISMKDGSVQDVETARLRVRNYTPIETRVPTAVQAKPAAQTVTPSPAPANLLPTPVSGDENPARVTRQDLTASMVRGAVVALVAFLLLGVYSGIRALFRER